MDTGELYVFTKGLMTSAQSISPSSAECCSAKNANILKVQYVWILVENYKWELQFLHHDTHVCKEIDWS